MKKYILPIIILVLLLSGGAFFAYDYYLQGTLPPRTSDQPTPAEYAVTTIPLAAPISEARAELSGLAWYNEHLILLPQYPQRFDNQLFALPKADVLAFLDGTLSAPLEPQAIQLVTPQIIDDIAGFQGFEAIGFHNNEFFATIESQAGGQMLAYLVHGTVAEDLSYMELDTDTLTEIPAQSDISNASDETLLIDGETVLTIYEGNGQHVNANAQAHQFNDSLTPLSELPFPNIEYRITDATALDSNNRFWVTNYLFPGSIRKMSPASDPLFRNYGVGATHAMYEQVERLVELQNSPTGIMLTDTPPIQLQLEEEPRNWEGIVRLEGRGFLLVTDEFPETRLGFVAYP